MYPYRGPPRGPPMHPFGPPRPPFGGPPHPPFGGPPGFGGPPPMGGRMPHMGGPGPFGGPPGGFGGHPPQGHPQYGGGPPMQYGGGGMGQDHGYSDRGQGSRHDDRVTQHQTFQGTVHPAPNFNALQDSEALVAAMKGFGCKTDQVINIICKRSNEQRLQIKKSFKTMTGKDLVRELISELRGHMEDTAVALFDTPAEFDAKQLRAAMKGLGTTESTLIEIMCTRSNAQIEEIKTTYKILFSRELEKDLASETSGNFKRLLVSMSAAGRDESNHVDHEQAKADATKLYAAGKKKLGTDEQMFNAILATRNHFQLRLIFEEYAKQNGHDIEKAIKDEFSGDIEDGWLTVG